jgi:hypothetical protein
MKKNFLTRTKEYFSHLKHSINNSFLLSFLWKFLKMQFIFGCVALLINVTMFLLCIFFNSNFFLNKGTFSLFLRTPLFIKLMTTVEIVQLTTTIFFIYSFYKSTADFKFQPVYLMKFFVMLVWFPVIIITNILGFINNVLPFFNNSSNHLQWFKTSIKPTAFNFVDGLLHESWVFKIVTLTNYLLQIVMVIVVYKLYKSLKKEHSQLNS